MLNLYEQKLITAKRPGAEMPSYRASAFLRFSKIVLKEKRHLKDGVVDVSGTKP
jgi:hypothetical protein